ncbi:MAG TPA: Xaa-Pro peptidase family protein [Pseudogracilibacillus sp.]|nr:Xaa-Pro peptidase family protein [Pseudogracilibacillus sp.]
MQKLTKLRNKLADQDLDGILVTNPYNRRYITGFTGSAGVVLITQNEAIFITDFRYVTQAKEQADGYTIIQHEKSIVEEIANQIERLGIGRLGFEENDITYADYSIYQSAFQTELIPTSQIIETIRLIKNEEELTVLREAATIADEAFNHIVNFIQPGMTEIEVANELEFYMRKLGATSSSFDIIVASGFRSALPHGVASEKKIQTGELITMDYGAWYKGYCSDITRTIAVGDVSDELKTIYDTVLNAQIKGVEGTKAGLTGKAADQLTREYITDKGYGQYFGHSTGHGLGLEVHELPRLAPRAEQVLEPGMVVTIEPGIYVPEVGGCRIEDDIVIKEDGNELLTHAPKDFIQI